MVLGSKKRKQKQAKNQAERNNLSSNMAGVPQLARRRANRRSVMRSGRTIGEKREKLETANERKLAHEKAKRKKRFRVLIVSFVFLLIAGCLAVIYFLFVEQKEPLPILTNQGTVYEPSIEIVDEDNGDSGDRITNRMREYIGQAEVDFRDLGYKPVKAVLPTGSVREVDFYLEGHPGFIKMIIDRETAPSVEDADRMLRYLAGQGITEFKYIDVRLPYKAYWQ